MRRGGVWLAVYRRSLSVVLLTLFAVSLLLHAVTGSRVFNSEQEVAGSGPCLDVALSVPAQFWFESLQNWQSEFLAVGAIVILSIFLRQHWSPESKPVHAPHFETGA